MDDLIPPREAEVVYETETPVLYTQHGAVAVVSMNRPRFGNTQNSQMTYALDAAFTRAVNDDSVRAVILRGEGKHFSSGHDIGSPGRDVTKSWPDRRMPWWDHTNKPGAEFNYAREQEVYLGMCRRWRDMPKPTVAAVQGACIAGGLMLAWVCDLIIGADDAFFADPVLKMGIPGVEYFAHAFELPPRVAKEFLLLGERMPAERAYHLGMVNRVVARESLDAEAMAVAERLAALPRFGVALAKQAINHVEDLRGKRTAMDSVFHMHHLAHAHNDLVSGNPLAGQDAKSMARANKQAG